MKPRIHLRLALLCLLLSGSVCAQMGGSGKLGGQGRHGRKPPLTKTLQSITIAPNPGAQFVGSSLGFTATCNYSDGTSAPCTGTGTGTTWSILIQSVATLGANSTTAQSVNCAGTGNTEIHAVQNGVTGIAVVTCNPNNPQQPTVASLVVSPSSASVNVGQLAGFTAYCTYSDGSQGDCTLGSNNPNDPAIVWASSNNTNATPVGPPYSDPENFRCLHSTGATVSATIGAATNTASFACTPVLVSIALNPANVSANFGTAVSYTATGTYNDGTQQDVTLAASWDTNNHAIATMLAPVALPELANVGNTAGTVTVTATVGVISGTASLTAVDPNPPPPPPTQTGVTLAPKPCAQNNGAFCSYTLTANFSDGSTLDVTANGATTWNSASSSVVTMASPFTNPERGTCIVGGNATSIITGSYGGFSDHTTQTCKTPAPTLVSVALSPKPCSQYNGSACLYTLTETYSDGSTQDVTAQAAWNSASPSVVTMGSPATLPEPGNCIVGGGATSVITGTFQGHSDNATQTCNTLPTPSTGENADCAANNTWIGGSSDGPATLPQNCMNTALANTPAPGSTVTLGVCSQSALQTALNALTAGQKLVVPASCTIHVAGSPITLPNVTGHDGTHWNWIETDQTGAGGFPAEHVRITPCADNKATVANYPTYACGTPAQLIPQILCDGIRCFTAASGAGNFRFIGIKVEENPSFSNQNSLIDLSIGNYNGFIFDRSILHGIPVSCTKAGKTYSCQSKDTRRGFNVNDAQNIALINYWAYDFACPQGGCVDAQAFWTGTGGNAEQVYKLYGGLMTAAGETFLSGGGGQGATSTTTIASDFEIRANHFFKPVAWVFCTACNGQAPDIKNNGELKNANRALIEGNVFENSYFAWQDDQQGFNLLLTPKNQSSFTSGTASSDGAGNLIALSGSFSSQVVSANCATATHCSLLYTPTGGTKKGCLVQTWTNATHVNCLPAPAAASTGTFLSFVPGVCPTCIAENITVRFNEFRNSTNGIQFLAGTSDGGDKSAGLINNSLHDNLFQGINNDLSNGISSNGNGACFTTTNSQPNPINARNYTFEHNTCATAPGVGFSFFAGLDATLDTTNTTTDGLTGAYFANRIIRNNIGPAGGEAAFKAGGPYPGGLVAGLAQQSCTPPLSATCTWTYARNVLGIGLWPKQTNNVPFPSTNQTCDGAGHTCFPSSSAFTSLFTNYNGPAGQPGYLGTYTLTGTYKNSGTDGKDIGISDWTTFNQDTAGVWSQTLYTAAAITTSPSLPDAQEGVPYSLQLGGTSASDFQVWKATGTGGATGTATCANGVTGTCIPFGMSLNRAGALTGTPTTPGSYTFPVQMMDGAQQYDTRTFALTVQL